MVDSKQIVDRCLRRIKDRCPYCKTKPKKVKGLNRQHLCKKCNKYLDDSELE